MLNSYGDKRPFYCEAPRPFGEGNRVRRTCWVIDSNLSSLSTFVHALEGHDPLTDGAATRFHF